MSLSPMMQQYMQTKKKYEDCLVFYRLGDFYELFFEDAKIASEVLDLTLTGRDCGLKERAPMCGVPHHSVQSYIQKLVENGYKVAICEQLTQPVKGEIVKRDVTRVITKGTATEDNLLESNKNNYIVSLFLSGSIYFAYCDISTAEFVVGSFQDWKKLSDFLVKLNPSEIVCNNDMLKASREMDIVKYDLVTKFTLIEEDLYSDDIGQIQNQFGKSITQLELSEKTGEIQVANSLINYFANTQMQTQRHIRNLKHYHQKDYMQLDATTVRNLEILNTVDNKRKNSILALLDKTKTSMGSRKLADWLRNPLTNKNMIESRLDAVDEFVSDVLVRENVSKYLSQISDIERLASKISLQKIMPRELIKLKNSLESIPNLYKSIANCKSELLSGLAENLCIDFEEFVELIENSIEPSYEGNLTSEGFIKENFDRQLDELRFASINGKKWLAEYETAQKEATGIKTLKIGYNKIFGYYIELTKSTIKQAPMNYIRKQTLANCERFITPELNEMENKILSAEEHFIALEIQIYRQIVDKLLCIIPYLQSTSQAISTLDCIFSFASVSIENNYCKPKINNSNQKTYICEGRHPIVEKSRSVESFIPNDTYLDNKSDLVMIITGPNMAGKSTYMRQVALIVFFSHIGCFVPAKSAEIALCDRIFTRIGASDNISQDQSTFMVEMLEVSNILENATSNSLIILDEIGRGTSTFDGLAIAWSVIEYIAKTLRARTLFATHYHELTELEGHLEGIKNYKITVKELNNKIIFLRKITRGGANKSFGIEVANLAGLPQVIITKAKKILARLESADINNDVVVQQNFFDDKQF